MSKNEVTVFDISGFVLDGTGITISSDKVMRDAYVEAKSKQKAYAAPIKLMAVELEERVKKSGIKDEKGHLKIFIGDEGKDGVIEHRRRVQTVINESVCKRIMEAKGQLDAVTETKVVISNDKVEEALRDGVITEDEFLEMIEEKVSYALYVI